MQNKFFSVMYGINIVFQATVSLLTPAALMFFVAWLFVSRANAPGWLYAVLIPIGVLAGLVSMIRFVIAATAGLERLEKQNKTKTGYNKKNEKK